MHRVVSIAILFVALPGADGSGTANSMKLQTSTRTAISYAIVSPRTSLHEPVMIDFKIDNPLSEPITADFGVDRKGGFRLSVTKPDGATIEVPPLTREGFSRIGRVTVEPGQSYKQRLVMNEWFDFPVPGRYLLELELTNPVRTQNGMTLSESAQERPALDVTPRDPQRLKSVCEDLFRQTVGSKSYEQAADAALALSYVRDPVAVTYLSGALKARKMIAQIAIAGLERIGNREAVDVLISALNIADSEVSILAKQSLQRVESQSTDQVVKERIRQAISKTS